MNTLESDLVDFMIEHIGTLDTPTLRRLQRETQMALSKRDGVSPVTVIDNWKMQNRERKVEYTMTKIGVVEIDEWKFPIQKCHMEIQDEHGRIVITVSGVSSTKEEIIECFNKNGWRRVIGKMNAALKKRVSKVALDNVPEKFRPMKIDTLDLGAQ